MHFLECRGGVPSGLDSVSEIVHGRLHAGYCGVEEVARLVVQGNVTNTRSRGYSFIGDVRVDKVLHTV